ncbi:CAAX prenyl protease-related protein [Massilia sp. H6]|uniref:CAAX prenyl protease-related protein n=1 Tax=Massilia sp. H6 TaxID=2970464 RepID=UPI002167FF26|nr:CAAX prenyl protease-related protein [Massilia sp. H6]UVW29920.1 CAAX prenyl protease-related protein [Massilia sp. H6]
MTEQHDARRAPSGPRPDTRSGPAPGTPAPDAPFLNRAAWARILPFAAWILFIILGDMLEHAGWARDALRWLYPLQSGVVALLLACSWRHYHELHHPALPGAGPLLACSGAGLLVFVLWINLDAPWMRIGPVPGYDPTTAGAIDWLLVASRIAGAALVVPVMEELFWRSFLMRWIEAADFEAVEPARVGFKGLLVSSLLFGVEHALWLAGIVAGLAYAFLYMRYRNLWSAVLAHAVTNGLLGAWVVATGNWSFW